MKQKRWALVKATVALAKASSRWDCFSSGESSWKLYPRPPVRKPIFVYARSTCCAVIPAHDVTPLEITFPFELTTQSELFNFNARAISFLLWRTAKQPFSPASSCSCCEIHSTICPMSTVAWITLCGECQKTGRNPPTLACLSANSQRQHVWAYQHPIPDCYDCLIGDLGDSGAAGQNKRPVLLSTQPCSFHQSLGNHRLHFMSVSGQP